MKLAKVLTSVLLPVFLLCYAGILYSQQLAFPTAEGYGKYVTGGRGGAVYEVTNLNASGTGSLGEAIGASGPRTVVFKVGGTIDAGFSIGNGDITIAGQTAPGDGICIKGLGVNANNVIVRYIRVRDEADGDAIGGRYCSNIIVDHVSASWSADEVMSFYHNHNVTIQWCIISEPGSSDHRFGGIWGNEYGTYHHNLFTHCDGRSPRWASGCKYNDYRNNVNYNWGYVSCYGGEAQQPGNAEWNFSTINMIANYYKAGPGTDSGVEDQIANPSSRSSGDEGSWYVADNYVHGYPSVTANNWLGVDGSSYIQLSAPWNAMSISCEESAQDAYLAVLDHAGCSFPNRDAVDERIINEVATGTYTYGDNGHISHPNDVGGFPPLASGTPYTDNDHDGMADDWETANGLNPSDASDRNDIGAGGYTMLEIFINSLVSPCDPEPVSGVSVSPTSVTVGDGATTQLTATVTPVCAGNKNVTWSSSNTSIATVSSSGLVTGVAIGTATVTVTTEEGGYTDNCIVTVIEAPDMITIQENETGLVSYDGIITTGFSGYTGDGCIDTDNAVGNGITWEICAPSSGTYTLQWRYSNGDSQDRPGQLLVDGTVEESNVSLPPTGGWTSWEMSSTVDVALDAGTRLIRLEGTTSSALGLTDYITITGDAPQAGECAGIPVTGVSVSPTTASIEPDDTIQLTATVEPSNASNKNVSWSTSNGSVATVDANGLVTGVADGSATITVTTEDGGFTATCDVTVSTVVVPVTGVSVSPATASIDIGATTQLTATVEPSNATNKNVSWSTSNASVATVDANGLVTGVADGSATITVTTEDGGFTATCDVTVSAIAVTGVTVSPTTTTISIGECIQLTETVAPSDATNKNVSWSSSDEAVATVSSTGLVCGVAEGSATITVTTEDGGFTAACNVTVIDAPVTITIQENETGVVSFDGIITTGFSGYTGSGCIDTDNELGNGITWQICVPSSGTYTLQWRYSCGDSNGRPGRLLVDGTVVESNVSLPYTGGWTSWTLSSTVDVALDAGTRLIRLEGTTSSALGLTDYITVTGNNPEAGECSIPPVPVTGVTVSPETASVNTGATTQLTATVEPSNATNKNVTWSSSNTSIATVNSSGLVTGVADGSATITVTTEDGGFTATCDVTVTTEVIEVTGVSVSPTTTTIGIGATAQLTETVAPSNATNKNVSWSTSESSVATVSSTGLVTGVAIGSATITVTTEDGGFTATCDVTVTDIIITTITIQENETGVVSYDGIITTGFSGYTGSGCIDTDNELGNGITWQICVPSSGTYTLQWRYSCGDSNGRPGRLLVDGTVVESNVSLPYTGGWTSWTLSTAVDVTLAAGTRLIRLEGTTSSALGLTDYITVTGNNPQAGECTGPVPVTGVSVSPATVSVGIGGTTQLTATVEPSNATNKNVTWSSSDDAIATVNSSGLVTGVALGSATITVTTEDGGFTATCDVTVSEVTITTITIQENETGVVSYDGSIDDNHSGYTGDGFINTDNEYGNGITWEMCAPASGTYTLEWRFANGSTTNRIAQVEVDGAVAVSNVDFPATGAWNSWSTSSSVDVTLSDGTRQIRLEATNSSGLANIDYISITGNNPQAGACGLAKEKALAADQVIIPSEFKLLPVYPNPFNPDTKITFSIPASTYINISVFDVNGRLIQTLFNQSVNAGEYSVTWDASALPSGVYFIKLMSANFSATTKCLLMK